MTYTQQHGQAWLVMLVVAGFALVATAVWLVDNSERGLVESDNQLPAERAENTTDTDSDEDDFSRTDQSANVVAVTSPATSSPAEGIRREAPDRYGDVPYVEVTESCDHNFEGDCTVAYAGPGTDFATTTRLRNGMVLRVGETVTNNGQEWHKISFAEQWLRYPERVKNDWYVAASEVVLRNESGIETSWEDEEDIATGTDKRIVIDKSEQKLYAYEGDNLFLETSVSTGLQLSPTTEGTFTVFKRTPSRYMQGPIQDIATSDYYDLAGVPWNLYFTEAGEVIHGTYWHDNFGNRHSHGCVNVPTDTAERLYHWTPLETTVVVQP